MMNAAVTDLLFARSQMALSLAFHIVFAAVGMGMPLLMAIAEGLYLRRREAVYLDLAQRWARGTAILFAVGAVSGTVLSFELGLLWPRFMEYAGGIIGMPFSLEGFAFFTEAIFLGIYLYGWDRISPLMHWGSGIIVALSGLLSGVFVVTVNAWMNAPAGFAVVDGRVTNIDPIAAMLNPASLPQVLHMVLAAYVATGFAVAAVHAFFLLRDRKNVFHRRAFGIALAVAAVGAPLQIVSGDMIARMVAQRQPAKFAAMEGHYRTESRAPLTLGGIPDDQAMTTHYAIRIPLGLSLLAHGDPNAPVRGLDSIPRDEWPNTRIVHWAFDLMVGSGFALLALAAWAGWLWCRRRRLPDDRWLLRALVVAGPLGLIAIEAGWFVTEVGRQPWIIYGVMRTAEAVTPMSGLVVPFVTFTAIYVFLSVILVYLLRRQFLETAPDVAPGRPGARPRQSRGD
jgi:cytochrome d ubiquinol oxidase subunit I